MATKKRLSPQTRETTCRSGTRERLVGAADLEFRDHGFLGTDTNKIARRAGFAPQTFYRWFRDKEEIFVAVYRAWEVKEAAVLGDLIAKKASASELANALIAHHRAYLLFRRSLRQLAIESAAVRVARAESRSRQLESIERWTGSPLKARGEAVVTLLQIERLSDAVAEEEFADLGLDDKAARAALTDLIRHLRRGSAP